MPLPVNIDATYEDDPTDASVKEHQTQHDTLHEHFNTWEDAGPPIVDTAANLAAANPVPVEGQVVYAIDTQEMAMGDGALAWNDLVKFEPRGGRELAYASTTATQAGITDVITDLNGLQISFEVTSRPVMIELFLPWLTHSGVEVSPIVYITDSSDTTLFQSIIPPGSQTSKVTSGILSGRINTPGQYTIRAQMNRVGGTTGSTIDVNAGLDQIVSYLRAVEL